MPRGILPPLIAPGERLGALLPEVAASIGAGRDVAGHRRRLARHRLGRRRRADASRTPPPTSRAARGGSSGVEVEHPVLTPEAPRRELHERGRRRRPRAPAAQRHGPLGAERGRAHVGARRAPDRPADAARLGRRRSRRRRRLRRERPARSCRPATCPPASTRGATSTGSRRPRTRAEYRPQHRGVARRRPSPTPPAKPDGSAAVDVRTIHIVGGGSLNELLCQRTADRRGPARARRARSRRPRSATCWFRRAPRGRLRVARGAPRPGRHARTLRADSHRASDPHRETRRLG